jgi:asparagine synthase (glutamine-hydrolysing)
MDTGAISTVASRHLRPMHTFTCGFRTDEVSASERALDESQAAREFAGGLGTRHHETVVGPDDFWPLLPRIVWHLDEPRVGVSYQIYETARLVRRANVKVVLSGVGGDELFGGYPWRYRRVAGWRTDEEFLRGYYAEWHRMVPAGDLPAFLSDDLLRTMGDYSTYDTFRAVLAGVEAQDPVQRAMRFDACTFLQGLFVVEDKLSMAHSIETRVPFTDSALAEYARALPARYSVDEHDSKIVLKRAMGGLIPDAILSRPKTGFTPPDASWYRAYHMDRIRAELLAPSVVGRGYFRPAYIEKILDEHATGLANHRFLIWSLLCFEWWNRLFLDGEPLPVPDAAPGVLSPAVR